MADVGPTDLVTVYLVDHDDWFDGIVESESAIGDRDYWTVRLDDGPVQHGRRIDTVAVPLDRPDLIDVR